MLQRYQRGLGKLAAVGLPEFPDNRAGSAGGLIDFARVLGVLPPEQRRAAFLVYTLEYTPGEAAQLLGLNPSTATLAEIPRMAPAGKKRE